MDLNLALQEVSYKIVYVGPGLSGKTTNLQQINALTPANLREKLKSVGTHTERTLFFDLLPITAGTVKGMTVRLRLYTVPGQVFYRHVRQQVLQEVDGVVFVADSAVERLEANQSAMLDLFTLMKEDLGRPITPDFPLVIQYNKRDLPTAVPIRDLDEDINPWEFPTTQATASEGKGVLETLHLLQHILVPDAVGLPADPHGAVLRLPAGSRVVAKAK